jgi:hypothetical protein
MPKNGKPSATAPAIVERASMAAYILPSDRIVIPQGRQLRRRGRAKQAGKTFRLEQIAKECKEGNHQTADNEPQKELHGFTRREKRYFRMFLDLGGA